jgi:DNA-binding response OmpR family regulator
MVREKRGGEVGVFLFINKGCKGQLDLTTIARLLWIEGKRAEGPSFVPTLRKKGFNVEVVSTGNAALTRAPEFDPDLVIINVASLRTNGKRICRSIHDQLEGVPILIITNSEQGNSEELCADIALALPFTLRKLMNRITPLLPAVGGKLLHVGPLRLNMELKRVQCLGREARLTPRLVHILQFLMQQPGVVIEREHLFRQVWKTDYTGDTRTLDVHISWLRKAIEEDPRKPQFLKTIRGVGYRLDV